MRLLAFLALTLAVSLVSPPLRAQGPREGARALATAGREAFEKGDFQKALQRFEAAEELVHAPPHLLYIARAHLKLRDPARARATYRKIIEEKLKDDAPEAFRKAQDSAREELAELDFERPRLAIRVRGPRVSNVTLDGKSVEATGEIAVEPGEHQIAVKADGYRAASRTVEVREGDGAIEVDIAMEADAPVDIRPEPDKQKEPEEKRGSISTGAIAITAVGGAVLLTGAVVGGVAVAKMSTLNQNCPNKVCAKEHEPLRDQTLAIANASTGLLVGGGAIATAGIIWMAVSAVSTPAKSKSGRISPWLGWGQGGLIGSF
jgi:hypothetical protein